MLEIRVRQSKSYCVNVSSVDVWSDHFLYWINDCFSWSIKRKRNSVKRESVVFSFLTDSNSGVHKGVVGATLS